MELSIEEALYYTKDMYSTTVVVNNLLLAIFTHLAGGAIAASTCLNPDKSLQVNVS